MKEIGGYFELEQMCGQELYSDLKALNTGRNALLFLLKARNIRKLYIPYFLCDSVSVLCERYGCEYEYYHIGRDFYPCFDKCLEDGEYLYVVNYYGQIDNASATVLKEKYKNMIFDNVQAFFQPPVKGIDTVYSCRKFFGVPDGAYLSTDASLAEPIPKDRSSDRMRHLLGRFEGIASDYYADFKANDHSFRELELREMSDLTRNLMRGIDYESARRRRNENFAVLSEALGTSNTLSPKAPDGPYCYPFYAENGMDIKKALAAKKIYVATLWPNVLSLADAGETELDYTRSILPLPCDQRYDREDMLRIAEELKNYIR